MNSIFRLFSRYRRWWLLSVAMVWLGGASGCIQEPKEVAEISEPPAPPTHFRPIDIKGKTFVAGGTVFVPVYSHIRVEGGRAPLTANLTIHNTDFEKPIIVTSLRFFDHNGTILRDYFDKAHSLEPMGAAEFFVEPSRSFTETALNFVVEWRSEDPVSEPVIEAVMANQSGTHGLAFVTTGRTIAGFEKP